MKLRSMIAGVVAVGAAAVTAVGPTSAAAFPEVIPLPDGFFPEGITDGVGSTFYAGSLSDGTIVRGDARTGAIEVLTPGTGDAFSTIGLDFDERTRLLFVAGGQGGGARIVDTSTGQVIATYDFGGGFVNDLIVTRDAAYFTDSFAPALYRVDLDAAGHPTGGWATVPLDGFTMVPGDFNANGIVSTADGGSLIVANSATGELYRVDSQTGEADAIDLGGAVVLGADGLVLVGFTVYVVQNSSNQVTELRLSPDLSSASVVDVITDDDFRVPTTAARFGHRLLVVNARFDVAPGPDVEYEVVVVDR